MVIKQYILSMIVKTYGKEIFNISREPIKIFIPINKELLEKIPDKYSELNDNEKNF